MIIGSHNSWSYLRPVKWWMKLLKFTARCQSTGIIRQYEKYGVRCFDLRVRFCVEDERYFAVVVHGSVVYDISEEKLMDMLEWLDKKEDVVIRVLLDVRRKRQYTEMQRVLFRKLCYSLETDFTHIKFWCGINLYNREVEYDFDYKPSCEERYSSVCKPILLDDWWPRLFARLMNRKVFKKGTDKDILLVDFVDIGR